MATSEHAMSVPILTLNIRSERDTVAARQRARQIARLAGFDAQDQTRIATAVSEIARNAFRYAGGGKVEYVIEGGGVLEALTISMWTGAPASEDLDRHPRRTLPVLYRYGDGYHWAPAG